MDGNVIKKLMENMNKQAYLKNMLRNMVALEQFMAFYVLMPGLRSIEKMELVVKIVKLSLQ